MAIKIINRSMDIPIPERTIGYIGDNRVETRAFELARMYGDVDLSTFDFKLDTEINGTKNIIDLDKSVTEDKITLTWTIAESHILHAGRMSIQLRAFSEGEEKWHSVQDYVLVQPSINATEVQPDPLPSEFEQMEQRVTVAKNAAEEAAQMATEQAGIVQQIVERAEIDVLPALNQSIEDAGQAKDLLDGSIEAAGTAKSNLDGSISAAGEAKTDLDGVITQAGTVKGQLDGSITQAGTVKGELDSSIATAGQTKTALDESIATGELAEFKDEFTTHLNDYATYKDSNNLKIAKIEKELNDYKQTMASMNVNQEAKQKATGYGIVSLPKNAANGQVSVSVKGNTETDAEGNIKSTVSAMRLKSVGKNLFDSDVAPSYTHSSCIYTKIDNGFNLSGSWFASFSIKPPKKNTYYTLSATTTTITGTPVNKWVYRYTDGTFGIFQNIGKRNRTDASKTVDSVYVYVTDSSVTASCDYTNIQLEEGSTATPYEPYTESTQYITAKDEEGKIVELRSLPNGTQDEIRLSEGKAIIKIGTKTDVASGTVINYTDMAENGTYYAWNGNGETETGTKGDTLGIDATTLIYQLAEPVEIPVQVSGTLVSYPSGTVYIEPYVADAGIYTDKMEVLHQDLPIKTLEKLSKIDFTTGLETELDVSDAVISEDKLSFTHPDLVDGDIVFYTYEYDREGTEGETEIEYYDSRYVIKDSVTGKFYKWQITVANGVPSIELEEV